MHHSFIHYQNNNFLLTYARGSCVSYIEFILNGLFYKCNEMNEVFLVKVVCLTCMYISDIGYVFVFNTFLKLLQLEPVST